MRSVVVGRGSPEANDGALVEQLAVAIAERIDHAERLVENELEGWP